MQNFYSEISNEISLSALDLEETLKKIDLLENTQTSLNEVSSIATEDNESNLALINVIVAPIGFVVDGASNEANGDIINSIVDAIAAFIRRAIHSIKRFFKEQFLFCEASREKMRRLC